MNFVEGYFGVGAIRGPAIVAALIANGASSKGVYIIAASGHFPVLVPSVLWKDCTTKGVVAAGTLGVLLALTQPILSPAIWVNVLVNAEAIYPYSTPTVFSMPLAFLTIWMVSTLGRAGLDRAGYAAQRVRSKPA